MLDFSAFPAMTKGPFPDWWKDWRGETCLLVASGPSAAKVDLAPACGRVRAIAVNNSWQLAPWADILYATDGRWWREYSGCAEFAGLRLTSDEGAAREFGITRCKCRKRDDRILLDEPGEVGWGGNSGFHALNLAIQFGCEKIILVGYDMQTRHGLHWHEDHPGDMHNPSAGNVERWRRAVDGARTIADMLGVRIINCAPESALVHYPKMSLEEALAA